MFLAIDVGNTQTVVGIYLSETREDPTFSWRIATNKADTADNIRVQLIPLLASESLDASSITGAALSSVVPSLSHAWMGALERLANVQALQCTAALAMETGLFQPQYPRPNEIGADRIADAVAARHLYQSPVIIADFGTATNIEVIDRDGCFVGGIIAPGVVTSAMALFSHATRLATVDLIAPDHAIGTNTDEAIRSGIVLGEAARIDGLIERIFEQLGYSAHVVATGGLASTIKKHSSRITCVNNDLTLIGLRLLALAASNGSRS